MLRVIAFEIGVGVPFAVAIDLDKTDAALDEAAGHQTFGTDIFRDLFVEAVKFERLLWLLADIHQVGSDGLHPERHLEGVDPRLDFRIAGHAGANLIEAIQGDVASYPGREAFYQLK